MEKKIIKKLATPQLVGGKKYDTVEVTQYRSGGKALICNIINKEKDESGNQIYVIVASNIFFGVNEKPFAKKSTPDEKKQLNIW